jgi:glycosyltransferase involved in cell wall biosynthesis
VTASAGAERQSQEVPQLDDFFQRSIDNCARFWPKTAASATFYVDPPLHFTGSHRSTLVEKRQILYFGNGWFTENRTSSHHVARRLGVDHEVHYFECPGLRAPSGSARDLRKIRKQLTRAFRGPVRGATGVQVRTLLQLPFHRFAVVGWVNRLLMMATVRLVMWRNGIRQPLVWCTVPHVSALATRLPRTLAVYYCIDDYSAVPGVDAAAVRRMDAELTAQADLVFVASETLLEAKRRINANVHHSPHGVDVDHFGSAQLEPQHLPELGARGGPVIGFFGLIEDYIDLDLLAHLADQRPEWTLLVIGRVAVPAERVPQRENLLFIGPRPYEALPDYGRHFAAAIIPYRKTDFTFHANPLKLREYLATGKPIVATRTPQMEQFADVIDVVDTPAEWLAALDRAVSTPQSDTMVHMRMARVAETSWDARVARVWSIVEQWLGRGTLAPLATGTDQPAGAALVR